MNISICEIIESSQFENVGVHTCSICSRCVIACVSPTRFAWTKCLMDACSLMNGNSDRQKMLLAFRNSCQICSISIDKDRQPFGMLRRSFPKTNDTNNKISLLIMIHMTHMTVMYVYLLQHCCC